MKLQNLFSNLKIGMRLSFAFGIIIILMLVTTIFILSRINSISGNINELYKHPFSVSKALLSAEINIQNMHKYMKDVTLAENPEEIEVAVRKVNDHERNVDVFLNEAKDLFLGDKRDFDRLIEIFTAWEPIRGEVISLTKEGNIKKAAEITKGKGALHVVEIENSLKSLTEFANTKATDFINEANEMGNQALTLGIIVSLFIIILTIFIAIGITTSITKPLTIAVNASNQLAKGDVAIEFQINSKDEIGILLESMKLMSDSLKKNALVATEIAKGDLSVETVPLSDKDTMGIALKTMVGSLSEKAAQAEEIANGNLTIDIKPISDKDIMGIAFKTMVDNLSSQINEIKEGVNVLASSTSEIMASVSQLASSAAETATSVGETTTTAEEVKQTAEVSNQKAQQVSESGQKTSEISKDGTKAIEDTIEGMNKIRQQMESIANMVVKLSEQSVTIGEITSTVSDLAEQSNLLAVNAAIEAAKAGEQGKGFAVVAQEIKNLADRSKESTAQVRGILNDIQKSISSAVMATEEGGKAVVDGLELSKTAGESIRALSESVSEAAQAAIQIASSSQQQLAGMDQVVTAMESIKEASVQTAASTKQSEISVGELHKLGEKLQELVKQYKLE